MYAQAFSAELVVEGFDVRIVGGLSWSAEVENGVVIMRPLIQLFGHKFTPLIDANILRIANFLARAVKYFDHIRRTEIDAA